MAFLTIYPDVSAEQGDVVRDFDVIASRLGEIGVELEHWKADQPLGKEASQEEVLEAYKDSIDKLNKRYGFKSIDVIGLNPDHPEKDTLRQKFLAEHTHADFEVRFFVEGCGLFYLHANDKVYTLLCEKGDLISVPANTTHWFDMGTSPFFKCIRFFTTPEGWVGNFTGSDIADRFPDFDTFTSSLS